MSDIQLRPWQVTCLNQATQWLSSGQDRHFLINAAPGAGKTLCASVIAKQLINSGEIERVVVIAPRRTVVRQWAKEFKFVTGREMLKITATDEEPEDYGTDLCATWSAVQGLLDAFQAICQSASTLVICDEHHHAAIKAAWGDGANGAFADAKYVLILTGTPIRSDGKEAVWLAYDDAGAIDHPEDGIYTLSYGDAVDLEYCRPITFHRHEGKFSVKLVDGENINVSGSAEAKLSPRLKKINGLQKALDYYKLACTPKYLQNGKADINSYQASMLEWCIAKLNDIRLRMPEAGGLVIAPNIPVAEYMAELLEALDGEKPVIVHSQTANPDGKIKAFNKNNKRWIVSVAMISEGVDIPRLRILAYLPNAQTELSFRQAMGRVVRNHGPQDDSRAYVVMPTHRIFEEYARRVEREMSPSARTEKEKKTKLCPECGADCERGSKACHVCDYEFPKPPVKMKTCDTCNALNPQTAKICQSCGANFDQDFEISLEDALRVGAIVRGMDLDESEVQYGEKIRDVFREGILKSGDETLVKLLGKLPEESYGRLAQLIEQNK